MSSLTEDVDGRVELSWNNSLGDHWAVSASADARHLVLSRAGLIVVADIPSAAVWGKLAELARVAEQNARGGGDPDVYDYRGSIAGASK